MTLQRITVTCPQALISDANNLAMVLGQGPDDGQTYGAPGWQDPDGQRYAVASFLAQGDWISAAAQTVTRPAWDQPPYQINLTGAGRAQAALVVSSGTPGPASPLRITACLGDNALAVLAAMGLQPLAAEDDV